MAPPRACILCRGIKVRCVNNEDYDRPCERCRRLDLPCAYQRARRNFKDRSRDDDIPVRLAPAPPSVPNAGSGSPVVKATRRTHDCGCDPVEASTSSNAIASTSPQSYVALQIEHPFVVFNRHGSDDKARTTIPSVSPSSSGLTPSVRNIHSPKGTSVLGMSHTMPLSQMEGKKRSLPDTDMTGLNVALRRRRTGPDSGATSSVSQSQAESSDHPRRRLVDDPVSSGYIGEYEAIRLVQLFHECLNPPIALLDPDLHTYDYLRDSSSVLFSAVLAASCKFFRKESYPLLHTHSQRLLSIAIEQGTCHKTIVQAALILVYWKQPTDQTAWVKIGLAIRLAYQLGWHKQQLTRPIDDLQEYREKLDAERTWFCLAAFDHTYSTLFDLPPTLRLREIGDCEQWARQHTHLNVVDVDLKLAWSLEMLRIGTLCRDSTLEFETIGAAQSFMRLERAYELLRAVQKKWQMFDYRDYPRQSLKECIATYSSMEIASLRFRMLEFVQPVEVENAIADCLHWSVEAVSDIRKTEHIMPFLQDVLSARLASIGSSLHVLYRRVSKSQQRLIVSLLKELHQICSRVSDDEPESAMAFVARFFENLLASFNNLSRQASRRSSPVPATLIQPPGATASTTSAEDVDLHVLLNLPDGALDDVLDTNWTVLDEQYWTSLFHTIPGDWNDFISPLAIL